MPAMRWRVWTVNTSSASAWAARRGGVTVTHVLITGGAGFIGSHLAEQLVDRGNRVTVLDDLSTGSYDNIGQLNGDERFEFVKGSVLDEALVNRLVASASVVYH